MPAATNGSALRRSRSSPRLELELQAELVEVAAALDAVAIQPPVAIVELETDLARRVPGERAAQPVELPALDCGARQVDARVAAATSQAPQPPCRNENGAAGLIAPKTPVEWSYGRASPVRAHDTMA